MFQSLDLNARDSWTLFKLLDEEGNGDINLMVFGWQMAEKFREFGISIFVVCFSCILPSTGVQIVQSKDVSLETVICASDLHCNFHERYYSQGIYGRLHEAAWAC